MALRVSPPQAVRYLSILWEDINFSKSTYFIRENRKLFESF